MTRINIGINPKNLSDQHLLAEHREIKRLPNFFTKRLAKNKFDDIPEKFTLNTGHVRYFLDKGKYTYERYLSIRQECLNRGYNVEDYSKNWNVYTPNFFLNCSPDEIDLSIITERITTRLLNSKRKVTYYKKEVDKNILVSMLNNI